MLHIILLGEENSAVRSVLLFFSSTRVCTGLSDVLILLFVFNVDFIFSALARCAFVIRSLDTGFPLERNIVH